MSSSIFCDMVFLRHLQQRRGKRMMGGLRLLLLMGFLAALPAGCSKGEDPVVYFDEDDAMMNKAIDTARERLPVFLNALEEGAGEFFIKAPVADGDTVEHIWLVDIRVSGSDFVGMIDNDPVDVTNVKLGESYRLAQTEISDWMVRRNGRIYGAYTLRVMLDGLPEGEAEPMRSRLAEPDQEP
jgi:uncharacterized protein YegJ (DUF2314 family)